MLRAIRREKSGRVRDRLRAVLFVMTAGPPTAAGPALGHGAHFGKRWVSRWNAEGYGGLLDKPRSGQPKRLAPHLEAAFLKRLDAGPTAGDAVVAFRGEDIRAILAAEFGADYATGSVYELLARLGRSHLVPRPRHPDAPLAERQAEFERVDAPLLSAKRRRAIPAKR